MDCNLKDNMLGLALGGFRQMSWHGSISLAELEGSPRLSPMERRHVSCAKLALFHINRLCNSISYLTDRDSDILSQKLESFEVEVLVRDVIEAFERFASGFGPLDISFSTSLKGCSSILLSKSHFELIILNLLYCAIKTESGRGASAVQISVTVTENKDFVVFHIRDNNKHINVCELSASPLDSMLDLCAFEQSIEVLVTLSLSVARKSTEEMGGKLALAHLKSGNRYDIYLPKTASVPTYTMCSPVRYTPDYSCYNEVFADIKLEHILTRVIESFEGELEGVITI